MFDWVLQQIGSGVYTVLVVVVQREEDCGPPRQVAEERSHQKGRTRINERKEKRKKERKKKKKS
jgi:acyl-CoA hydrolase